MKSIVVIGGGISGFLAVNRFLSISDVDKIWHIYSDDIPPIGVGEGTTPNFVHMLESTGVNVEEFIEATDATIKHGVFYKGWWNKDFVNFFLSNDLSKEQRHEYESLLLNKETFDSSLTGIHFNCFKAIDFFKQRAQKDSRYENIKGVAKVNLEDNKVSSVLVNGKTIEATYYINAAQAGLFGEEYTYVNDYNNTAVVAHVDKVGDFQYTEALAMSAGWRWSIPLKNKVGYGYVFDSKEISIADATKELSDSIGEEIDTRIIKYQSKHAEKAFLDNACTIGLAQNFLDPLDTLSMLTTIISLEGAVFHHASRDTNGCNIEYDNLVADCKRHLNTQYKLSIGTTPYWLKRQSKDVEIADKSNSLTMHTLSGRGL